MILACQQVQKPYRQQEGEVPQCAAYPIDVVHGTLAGENVASFQMLNYRLSLLPLSTGRTADSPVQPHRAEEIIRLDSSAKLPYSARCSSFSTKDVVVVDGRWAIMMTERLFAIALKVSCTFVSLSGVCEGSGLVQNRRVFQNGGYAATCCSLQDKCFV